MFRISAQPIDTQSLRAQLDNARAGAVAVFEGIVRNHNDGRSVRMLEYEAYEQMAEKEAAQILGEARSRFGVIDCLCVHRVGSLQVGETAVWVAVLAEHRGEAFDACRFIIDEVKHRLPIWKKEHYADGDSGWVNCQHSHVAPAAEKSAYESWQLDALDLSGADLRRFEVIDVCDQAHVKSGADSIWALLRCDVRRVPASTIDVEHPQLSADKKYLFVCGDGLISQPLVAALRQRGHDNAYTLIGGANSLRRKIIA